MSHPYAYRTLPMLLFPAALSACGGIDEEACEASKASAYQAWESYRHALEEASDAQRLSAATTIRDSYLHEGYSPVAENALRTSMEVLFTAPGGASEAESSSLGRLVRAVSDPLLADAVDASTEVLGLCRSEGEPWPLGERVQASLNAKPEREAAQERLVRLAAGLEPAAPESLATALSTVGQAIGSCEELAGPNGPFDIVALNMGSEVPSASLSSSLQACGKLLEGATLLEVAGSPTVQLEACEIQRMDNISATFARGDRRFEMKLQTVFAFGDQIGFSRAGCSESPLSDEVAREVLDRFDKSLRSDRADTLELIHCCDLRPEASGPACRPELLQHWHPQFKANWDERGKSGQSWGVWGPNELDELHLLTPSPSATVANVGWTDVDPGRTGMDSPTSEQRSITLLRDEDDWKVVGVVGLVDNYSSRVFGKAIPPERDALQVRLDLHSRSVPYKLRAALTNRCLITERQRVLDTQRAAVIRSVEELRAAMIKQERRTGFFPSCGAAPAGEISPELRAWEGAQKACFDELGWSPGEQTACTYTTQNYRGSDFWVRAECDLDGDGVMLRVEALRAHKAHPQSASGVY